MTGNLKEAPKMIVPKKKEDDSTLTPVLPNIGERLGEISQLLVEFQKYNLTIPDKVKEYQNKLKSLIELVHAREALTNTLSEIKKEPEGIAGYINMTGDLNSQLLFKRLSLAEEQKKQITAFVELNKAYSNAKKGLNQKQESILKKELNHLKEYEDELSSLVLTAKNERYANAEKELEAFESEHGSTMNSLRMELLDLEKDDNIMSIIDSMRTELNKQNQEKIQQKCAVFVEKLQKRHTEVLGKLNKILGNVNDASVKGGEKATKSAFKILCDYAPSTESKANSFFDKMRNKLRDAILMGEGDMQIKNPSDIIPWEETGEAKKGNKYNTRTSDRLFYREALDYLKLNLVTLKNLYRNNSDTGLAKLIATAENLIKENSVIFRLVGPEFAINKHTGQTKRSDFWENFELREFANKTGIIGEIKKTAKAEFEKAKKLEQEINQILMSGGIKVEIKITDNLTISGAVLLEKVESEKGGYYKIKKLSSNIPNKAQSGLNKKLEGWSKKHSGSYLNPQTTSLLTMQGFPEWLRKAKESLGE